MTVSLKPASERRVAFGPFIMDRERRNLLHNGTALRLRPREFDVLQMLIADAGNIVTLDQLRSTVWSDRPVTDTTIRLHVASLKRAMGDLQDLSADVSCAHTRYISIVNDTGFRFSTAVFPQYLAPATQPPSAGPQRQNLPARIKPVFGRETDIQTLIGQTRQNRLSTVTGAAGIGKSAVTLAAAAALTDAFSDGLRFVDLAPLSDPGFVPSAIGSVLGVSLNPGAPIQNLVEFLDDKHLLIVLDNCDHVIDATVALVARILAETPMVHVLITSRQPPNLADVVTLTLGDLMLPTPAQSTRAEDILTSPAARTFMVAAGQGLSDDQAGCLGTICRSIGGNPFALEVAGGRAALFGIEYMSSQMKDCLTRFAHLQTSLAPDLAAPIILDWSYEFLSDTGRAVLRRLAIFRGPFTRDLARSVAGHLEPFEDDADVAIDELIAANLIQTDASADPVRLRLPMLTRDFAFDRLVESGELPVMEARHARACLDQLEAAAAPGYVIVMDDIRAAIAWAFSDNGNALTGMRLTALSIEAGKKLYLLNEYADQIDRALERFEVLKLEEPRLGLRLLIERLCLNQHTRNDDALMQKLTTRAFELAHQLYDQTHDPADLFAIHHAACSMGFSAGDGPDMRYYADQMAELARKSGVSSVMSITAPRMQAQACHFLGEHSIAVPIMERIMRMPGETIRNRVFVPGDRIDPRISLSILHARTLWMLGRPAQATAAAHDLIERARPTWDHILCYVAAFSAIPIAIWRGNTSTARLHLTDLNARAVDRGLDYWRDWGRIYDRAMDTVISGQTVTGDLGEVFTTNNMQTDLVATLHESLLTQDAITRVQTGMVGWCAAEVLRVETERGLLTGALSPLEAEAGFNAAKDIAVRQGALGWELRIAMSLARLWRYQGKARQGMDSLANTLSRFTEGFGDSDLVAADALLKDLSAL